MEELQKQLAKAQFSNDKAVFRNPIESLGPEYQSQHKHAL